MYICEYPHILDYLKKVSKSRYDDEPISTKIGLT